MPRSDSDKCLVRFTHMVVKGEGEGHI